MTFSPIFRRKKSSGSERRKCLLLMDTVIMFQWRQSRFGRKGLQEMRTLLCSVTPIALSLIHIYRESCENRRFPVSFLQIVDQCGTFCTVSYTHLDVYKRQDVGRILRESLMDSYHILEKRALELEAEIPEHIIEVLGDASALERIFLNLIQNAGRYAQSFLHVFVREQKQQVWICFENDAFNVTEADVEHLFERFYRKDRARTQEGTGLGLTVAKQLAEAMEAKLTAELIREHQGNGKEEGQMLRFTLEMKLVR